MFNSASTRRQTVSVKLSRLGWITFVLGMNMKQNRTVKSQHLLLMDHEKPTWRPAKCLSQAASMTHLAAGVLAGIPAGLHPLMGAVGVGAGALVPAGGRHPCPGPLLPILPILLTILLSDRTFTSASWLMDCLAVFWFSASFRSCHHFCSEQTYNT